MSELIASLEIQSDAWSTALWRSTLTGAAALALAWILTRYAASARVNCWIWRLACVKLLVALFWTQAIPLPILTANPDVVECPPPTCDPAPPLQNAPETSSRPSGDSKPHVPREHWTGPGNAWANAVLLAWVSGVGLCIAMTARQGMVIRRICRSGTPVSDEPLLRLYHQAAAELQIRNVPELRISPLTRSAFLAGIWRPAVILPNGNYDTFGESERRLMLIHELAHHLRRDLVWNWMLTIVGWLFFFHPFVWLMRRCWSESQENACDALLLQRKMARPAEYGRLLVKVAAQWSTPQSLGLGAVGVQGTYRNLEQRILAMTHVKSPSQRRMQLTAWTLVLAGLVGIIPWKLVARAAAPENADGHKPHAVCCAPKPP